MTYDYPYFQQPQMQRQIQPQQIQNSGFIVVRNEMEARNYPVAFGNSVTFRDENAPFMYTKTMGFSQLQPPIFEKYRLVKEDTTVEEKKPEVDNSAVDSIKGEIENIWKEIETLKKEISDGV